MPLNLFALEARTLTSMLNEGTFSFFKRIFKRLALDIAWACKGMQSYDLNCVPTCSYGYCNTVQWVMWLMRIHDWESVLEQGRKGYFKSWELRPHKFCGLRNILRSGCWSGQKISTNWKGGKYEMGYEKVWYPSVDLIATCQHVHQSTLAEQKVQ